MKIIRECEFSSDIKRNTSMRLFLKERFPSFPAMNETTFLSTVMNNELFGFVEYDIVVPVNLRERFSAFPPIFKNTTVTLSDISPLMHTYATEHNLFKRGQRLLISYFSGKKIVLATLL